MVRGRGHAAAGDRHQRGLSHRLPAIRQPAAVVRPDSGQPGGPDVLPGSPIHQSGLRARVLHLIDDGTTHGTEEARMRTIGTLKRGSAKSGQILVITGLMLTVLIGFTALAIDVGMAFLSERWQRSVADAAALAGAQSLQMPDSRALPDAPTKSRLGECDDRAGGSARGNVHEPRLLHSAGCALTGSPYHVSSRRPHRAASTAFLDAGHSDQHLATQFGLVFHRSSGSTSGPSGRRPSPAWWWPRSTASSLSGHPTSPKWQRRQRRGS